MEFQFVSSTNVQGLHYDPSLQVLTVQFTNGSRYSYQNVPAEVYDDFLTASSPGSYFAENVKNEYSYARVG